MKTLNPSAPLVVVGLDPAGSTGWSVAEVSAEARVWHGQCPLEELPYWLAPLVEGKQCLVAIERGYLPQNRMGAGAANIILLLERTGQVIGLVNATFQLAAPIWRPTATQWRGKYQGWMAKTRGRPAHKARAVATAAALLGGSVHKELHQTENGRKVAKRVTLEDEADATCIQHAALRFYNTGAWPLWSEVDEDG